MENEEYLSKCVLASGNVGIASSFLLAKKWGITSSWNEKS